MRGGYSFETRFLAGRIQPISIIFYSFCTNSVLNISRYLKTFFTYTKINNHFLKLHYSLLRMTKS